MSNHYTKSFNPIDWPAAPHDFTGDNLLGIHTTEATQRYIYGTRYITWDGRVFKYSLSGASCYTTRLNAFYNTISSDANGIDYSVLTNDQSAGDREITLTNGSTAIAEDYLAGGLAVIIPSETYTDGEVMQRIVVGNTAAIATTGECTMYLEEPLETAVTTSEYAYVMPSSYRNIRYANTGCTRSFAGLAATYVSAASLNFWLQTYGLCQITNGGTEVCGKTTGKRYLIARHDGSCDVYTEASVGANQGDQWVGFILDNNGDANGVTNFMLTISF